MTVSNRTHFLITPSNHPLIDDFNLTFKLAADNKNWPLIEQELLRSPDLVKQINPSSFATVLREAAAEGRVNIVRNIMTLPYFILFKDTAPLAFEEALKQALGKAAEKGQLESVREMLNSSLLPDISEFSLQSAFENAARNGHLKIGAAIMQCPRFARSNRIDLERTFKNANMSFSYVGSLFFGAMLRDRIQSIKVMLHSPSCIKKIAISSLVCAIKGTVLTFALNPVVSALVPGETSNNSVLLAIAGSSIGNAISMGTWSDSHITSLVYTLSMGLLSNFISRIYNTA